MSMRFAPAAVALALLVCAQPGHATGEDIVVAARSQVGVTLHYDPAYQRISYPNGDVAPQRGVCTDVIVRALRRARGLDLQRAVHEDMAAHARAYPRRWGSAGLDTNIDHRRVPNLMAFFKRQGYERPISAQARDYLAGDIVAWDLGGGTLHIGIVSDRHAESGTPLVVHNIGAGAREEDMLFSFRVIGHYRL